LKVVSSLSAKDLVIALNSGGGSALLPMPAGMALADAIAQTYRLALLITRAFGRSRAQLRQWRGGS